MPQLVDAYFALMEITGENPSIQQTSEPGTVKERQYAQEYLDENSTSGHTIAIRKRILNGSRSFLEKKFLENVDKAIEKNQTEARLGGIPTTINKIRAYIRIRAARKELGVDNVELQQIGDDYPWVLIFYLIRGGLLKEALEYVQQNSKAFKSIERNIVQYVKNYADSPDRRLEKSLQTGIQTLFQKQRIEPNKAQDPYRVAVLKIIGRCELNRRTLEGLNQDVEDWVWLQFALAREVNRLEDSAGEAFGLEEVRATVKDIGQKHFQHNAEGGAGSGIYFLLQILAGLFEEAVSYLYQANYISAVHVAIGLDYYGLLRVSDFTIAGNELLTYTTTQKPQINFDRMVGIYTMDFRVAKPDMACDYLCLICLHADLPGQLGQSHAEICHEALRELVLETRDFVLLIGDVRKDGRRIKGVIGDRLKLIKLATEENFYKRIALNAAVVADNNGRTVDAVLLYYLADDMSKVLDVATRALSDALATDLGQSMRLQPLQSSAITNGAKNVPLDDPAASTLSSMSVDDPLLLARTVLRLSSMQPRSGERFARQEETLETLMAMMDTRNLVEAKEWSKALDVGSRLPVLGVYLLTAISAPAIQLSCRSTPPAIPDLRMSLKFEL
jgi:nuclear pore complex protein Nup93